MSRVRTRSYQGLFLVAAVLGILVGFVLTFFAGPLYEVLDIADEMPAGGYVQFIGASFLILGIGYALVFEGDFWRNRDLILVGTLFKLALSAVAITFWVMGDLPHIAFGVLGIVDACLFVLMLECWIYLRRYPRIDLELVAAHPEAYASMDGWRDS